MERDVPSHLRCGLLLWIEHGVPPGDFLLAVLKNNLFDAVGRADSTSLAALPGIVWWCYSHAPAPCWGSPEAVRKWAKKHEPLPPHPLDAIVRLERKS